MIVVDYLSPQEVAALLSVAEDEGARDELIVRILLFTGMRIGELAALTVGDVDVRRGAITLSKVIVTPHMLGMKETHGGGKGWVFDKATGKKRRSSDRPSYSPGKEIAILLCDTKRKALTGKRTIGKPAELLKAFPRGELIKDGLKARHPIRVVPLADRRTLTALQDWTKDRPRNEFLWISNRGGRLNVTGHHRLVEALMLKAAIPAEKAHPHMLRHTFAVNFLKKTRDLPRLQRILGHSDIATTTIYLRFAFEDLRDALEKAGDLYSDSSQ